MHSNFAALKVLSKEYKDIDSDFDKQSKKFRVLKSVAEEKLKKYEENSLFQFETKS